MLTFVSCPAPPQAWETRAAQTRVVRQRHEEADAFYLRLLKRRSVARWRDKQLTALSDKYYRVKHGRTFMRR